MAAVDDINTRTTNVAFLVMRETLPGISSCLVTHASRFGAVLFLTDFVGKRTYYTLVLTAAGKEN